LTLYQTELYNNGPLQACFTVYNNFYTFFDVHPTGIYTSSSGSVAGGHCVKLIGWGTTNGQDYWLFANSWDTNWADKGYFRMARGDNLCGIEGSISEGFTPKQATARGTKGVHPDVATTQMFVGGYTKQQELDQEHIIVAARAGLLALSEKLHRTLNLSKIISAETQVVAGLNFKLEVATVDGPTVAMKVYRDLKFGHKLLDYSLNFL
jgi:hypothetical protein